MIVPEESILKTLQELINAYTTNTTESLTVAVKHCKSLLQRRTALDKDSADAVQRLLLQCYIQQMDYANVRDYGRKYPQHHRDLVLYAQYRQEEYDVVSQQANSKTSSVVEQHLLAQSHYHLNQINPAIRVYQEMLQNYNNNNNNNKDTDSDSDTEGRMEVLTNALAVVSATVVPYVTTTPSSLWLEHAHTFLKEHPDSFPDLCFNVGTVQCLTGSPPPNHTPSWLETAHDVYVAAADDDHEDDETREDRIPIEINLQWSKHFWSLENTTTGMVTYDMKGGSAPLTAVLQHNQALLDHRPLAPQPHPKWNHLQVQLYWYNRAVQQYQSKRYVECQESCQSLRKTFGTNKRSSKGVLTTPSDWWWQSRIDVILAYVLKEQSKLDAAITRLEERYQELQKQDSCNVIDHATAYIQLHLHALRYPNNNNNKEEMRALLKSLPASIQSKPAVVATLQALERAIAIGSNTKEGAATNTSSPTDEANSLLDQGQYEEAARLLDATLPPVHACDQQQLLLQLKRVQALALCGQHDASTTLLESVMPLLDKNEFPSTTTTKASGGVSGESLETKGLPRTSTSKALAVTTLVNNANVGGEKSKPKRSKESVLRQRARKREAFLKALEEKGQYNPVLPSKPNAERWIPKHERSRARRRGQNSRAAQGGGSQAEAQKLDAAARRAGRVPPSAVPSTATMKVSSGSRKARGRR